MMKDLKPECEFDADARFGKSLLELKDLSSQLHCAANYCEMSFLKSTEKKMVLENTKEYICRALVTVVDHLGSVSANLEGQFLANKQFSDTECRMSCLQQVATPDLEKSKDAYRDVDDSLVFRTTEKYHLDTGKEMPLILYTSAQKPSLTKLSSANVSCVQKVTTDSSSGLKLPPVLPVCDPFLISIPRNPSFHFQFLIIYLSLDSDDGQAHVDEYVRALCMYLMGVLFLPSSYSTINLGYLANFEHLHELGGIDFGGAIYYNLLHCLDRASRQTGVVSSPQMGWVVILLEVWFYEYFRAANPILTEYTDERPRLRAWHGPRRARLTSEISHNITYV
ncbi:hypothetical protein IFM89_039307 [Coptis chinensis]|uniref:Uncharacterized protein n=1 Tax=Coptis chinensis TaxID=261450 RepID=A0A835M696_9MAGN|nr:hypothetical protein IFM89_039307 [Coptis chinensis]